MIEKLMIDEKKCYLFGRNSQVCDFCIDHQSCSRVHAALVYHKHLNRSFLMDLGSTHGTYLGSIRLESNKPQQVPVDSTLRFGASTRSYVVREKPQTVSSSMKADKEEKENKEEDELHGGLLGLPEEETELDNLTEFNTAHNKRLGVLGGNIEETATTTEIARPPLKRKRRNSHVSFQDGDEVINPEDVDPSVGRFRNLVSVSVIPAKKKKTELIPSVSMADNITKRLQSFSYGPSLYADLPATSDDTQVSPTTPTSGPFPTTPGGASFNFVPNLAPEVGPSVEPSSAAQAQAAPTAAGPKDSEPKKKYFPKEAWPGKKPTQSLLL
ncbi:nuclear inhibitor of protein phosphatase 1-like [Glandiceps talaboti]